jgi:hypothetical protein
MGRIIMAQIHWKIEGKLTANFICLLEKTTTPQMPVRGPSSHNCTRINTSRVLKPEQSDRRKRCTYQP